MNMPYNILTKFGIPMKLVMLIKLCLNEANRKVWTGKYLSDKFPFSEWSETRTCFITTTFLLCFRPHH